MDRTRKVLMAALGVMVLYPASPGEAQLMEVRQTVFGMDCAPCAYAVERRMANLDGAAQVTLSLNAGFAQVRFDDLHGTTLEEIRRAIRDSGFGARDARVLVRGRIVQEEGVLVLRTPAGEGYRLRAAEPANLPGTGMEGDVEGQVGADRDDAGRWLLDLERTG